MKKALVISLMVVAGLGLAAFAGPLSGSWCVYTGFQEFQAMSMLYFESDLTLDYTTCGWTFSSTAVVEKHGFTNLYFEGQGSVGAFGFYGVLDFIPQTPSFRFLAGAANLSIAGMTAYAIGVVQNFVAGTATAAVDNGIGVNVGAFGVAGVCSLWVEAQFNLDATIGDIYSDGYDYVVGELLSFETCATGMGLTQKGLGYEVEQTGCCACWSGLDIYVEYPFGCLDLITKVNFSCDLGFEKVCFELDDICVGLDWLILDDLNICFELQTKSVCGQFELVLADCVCLTPYMSLIMGDGHEVSADPAYDGTFRAISGISLDALTLEYDMGQGVTIKAGTFFRRIWGDTGITKTSDEYGDWCDENALHCWAPDGSITSDAGCEIDCAYDEYFGVLIDGDACCGGAFSVSVFTWFDDELTPAADSFMDWAATTASLSIGFGSNTTFGFAIGLDNGGLASIDLSACFTF